MSKSNLFLVMMCNLFASQQKKENNGGVVFDQKIIIEPFSRRYIYAAWREPERTLDNKYKIYLCLLVLSRTCNPFGTHAAIFCQHQ